MSKTRYVRHHGTRLADDICETPSVMLETWTWRKDILQKISRHYTTIDPKYLEHWRQQNPGKPDPPEKIPMERLDSLLKGRNTMRTNMYIQQL